MKQIETRIQALERRLKEIERECEFAEGRAAAHKDGTTLADRWKYAGAVQRIAELKAEAVEVVQAIQEWRLAYAERCVNETLRRKQIEALTYDKYNSRIQRIAREFFNSSAS